MRFLVYAFLIFAANFSAQALAAAPFFGLVDRVVAKANLDCTDFSGSWKGLCISVEDGVASEMSNAMAIEMSSCEAMVLEKNTYPLDGVKSETTARPSGITTIVMNMNWNDTQKMEFINVAIDEQITTFKTNERILWNASGTMKIENSKLILNLTASLNGKSMTRTCRYGL